MHSFEGRQSPYEPNSDALFSPFRSLSRSACMEFVCRTPWVYKEFMVVEKQVDRNKEEARQVGFGVARSCSASARGLRVNPGTWFPSRCLHDNRRKRRVHETALPVRQHELLAYSLSCFMHMICLVLISKAATIYRVSRQYARVLNAWL